VAAKKLKVIYERSTMTPELGEDGTVLSGSLYPPSSNPCSNCQAVCCTSRIETSIPDMVDFCFGLGVPFHTAFELAENGLKPFELEEGPRIFVLQRSDDGYCRFLGRYGDELRCGVYGLRPATCQLYPFTFRTEDQRIGPKLIRCPVPFGIKPDLKKEMTRAATKALTDWALHDALVKRWKRKKKRSLDRFLRFCVKEVYAHRGQELPNLDKSVMFSSLSSKERAFQDSVERGFF